MFVRGADLSLITKVVPVGRGDLQACVDTTYTKHTTLRHAAAGYDGSLMKIRYRERRAYPPYV